MTVFLNIKPLNENFKMPKQAHAGDAGFDVAYCGKENIELKAKSQLLIPCGFAMDIPSGYEVQVRPRSGLAAKHGITVLNSPGTIDCSYTGECKVILYNSSDKDYVIEPEERVAQLVVAAVPHVILKKVSNLKETTRGDGGFGSSGKK